MTRFFHFFVSRHLFANILTIAIILLGLAVLPSINRDTFPSVDLDEVVIVTRYDGASPEDIELKITNKIEDALKRIDGLKKTTSFSVENTSLIQILIEPNIDDPKKTKDLIREKIDAINDFPTDLIRRPTVTIVDSATFPIMEIGLTSSILSYPELRAIAKKFKSDLSDLKGISQVDGYGYLNKELKITPTPDRLEQYQVSLSDIVRIISDQNRRASLGTLNQNSKKNTIINDNRLFSEKDINNAIVRANFNGQSIRISDLGTVSMGFETPTILSRISGQGGISFNILKSGNADIITVSNKIDALVAKYKTQHPDITFIKANDFSMYLKNRLKVMINNGIIGLILVNGVLWFFLNLRTAFWVSLGIPVAVMGVFFLMPPLGMTINIISLLALIIVIGIIVDDGIIVAENIAKFREKGLSPIDASVAGIQSVFKPVLTTILTTIIAFSPMFFMSGVMGKFIFQIPLVIACALLISLVEVVIALPSHLAAERYNRPLGEKKRHQLIKRFRHQYETVLGGFLRNKYIGVIGFLILFFASIFYMTQYMNFVLFPNASATQFFIRTESPAGTSLEETAQRMARIEQALLRLPENEVMAITTRVGMMGDAYMMVEQENLGIIMVDLVPFTGRDRSAQEIMEDIKEQTKNTPGFTNISYQVNSGGPPVGKAININIISNNDAQRTAVANAVYDYVGALPGVISVERSDKKQRQQFQLAIDHDTVAKLGINIQTIHQTVRTAFSGNITSSIRMGDEDINFNVGFSDADKTDVQVLRNILIPNNQGRLIRLKDMATITLLDGEPNYRHFDTKRCTTINGDIDTDQITSTEVSDKVAAQFSLDKFPDVSFSFGGEAEETNASVQGLIRSFILAIVGIFFLLILLFNSLTQPLIVILTIPFGLIGVIIAFALHGQDLGFISIVGTVGLTGVVVNDSLVLVNHLNSLKSKARPEDPIIPLVVQGSGDRFRPILITSCTTVAGLLPLAYGLGGSDPFIAPMALALGYGLLFSTPLTLFLLPALYLIQHDIQQKVAHIKSKYGPNRIT